jgi:serine/threonine/tyrosine-interacting protein
MYEPDINKMLSQLPSKISDNIFQGGYLCSEEEYNLKELGITHILVAAKTLETHFPNTFKYLKLDLIDDEEEDLLINTKNILSFFDDCFNNKGKILVHCSAGSSRSTACIIIYLITHHKMTYDIALDFIKKGRKYVEPNSGFIRQIKFYEKSLQI